MKSKMIWIISAVLFCTGTAFITIGFLMGGSTQAYIRTDFFTGNRQEEGSFISFAGRNTEFEEIELDDVSAIFCGGDLVDINIIKSDRSYISHNVSNFDFEISDENIIYAFDRDNNNSLFNIGIFSGFGSQKSEINIYVADELEYIDVKAEVGSVKLVDLTVKELIIDSNLGDVQIDSLKTNTANIGLDLGNLEMKNFEILEEGEFLSNLGNIELELVGAVGDFTIIDNVSLGSSNVDTSGADETGRDKAVIHAEAQLGNIDIDFTE